MADEARTARDDVHEKTQAAKGALVPVESESRWGVRIRRDLERTLHERVAPPGTRARRVESSLKISAGRTLDRLKKHAGVGVALAAGLGWLAADVVGVGEITMVVGFAYVAYEVLRKGVPLEKAVGEKL
jgi:hypothetical protein